MKQIRWFLLQLLFLSCLTNLTHPASFANATAPEFIRSDGTNLLLDNQPVLLKGFNYYPRDNAWSYMWTQWDAHQVQTELAKAAILGSNTLRVLVPYGNGYGWNNDKTGQVNPQYLNELSQFVQLAGNFKMRVILTLFDFYGTFPAAGSSEEQANLNYLQTIVTTFAGDDRVLAWDLHNEPDNYDTWKILHQPNVVIDWMARMAAAVRHFDPNHLLTFDTGDYQNLWLSDGQGRTLAGLSDFVSLHSYNSEDFGNEFYHLREHTHSPILLEETGWPTGPIFGDPNFTEDKQQKVYELAVNTVKQTSLVGLLGWTLSDFVPLGIINVDDFQNYYGVIRRNGTLKPAGVTFRDSLNVAPLPSTVTSNLLLTSQPLDEAPRTLYFPQTDHYVSTPLKELWRRAGGEAIFGLPLTDAIVVQKGDDGTATGHNAKIVQYFERARFEYYPDKIHDPDFGIYSHILKYFYIIDFGQLGREIGGDAVQNSSQVTRRGPDGPDYQFFPTTGHDLSGAFLSFWNQHYGNKLFGAPLTQIITENGLTVQYFERVRLEYHPELKGQGGEVQVSKLGTDSARTKGWLNNRPGDLPAGSFAEAAFQKNWVRIDQPLASASVRRSWLWGPNGFAVALEEYVEGMGGQRLVQYFDKSRMELTHPAGDPTSKWYVTNGLLVKELISGYLQTGDNKFRQLEPAQVAIAGDPTEINPDAPTYASFQNITTLNPGQNVAVDQTGQPLTNSLTKNGQVGQLVTTDPRAGLAHNANYISDTGHNIPDVFWNYLTGSRGLVLAEDGKSLIEGDTVDWQFSVGLPITEAYWVKAKIAGVEQDVLVQAFERRMLTYTPSNPLAFQVEMGNVGRHYYTWRYLTGR